MAQRLSEPRRFIQAVVGPRQVGKTTLVQHAVKASGLAAHVVSADEPTLRGHHWLAAQWEVARQTSELLVVDEIQKVPDWSETVKRLWDDDTREGRPLKVVVLGSAPLLVEKGLSESLAGRFETVRVPHWAYGEMKATFGLTLEQYIFYGAYPGAAALIETPERWRRYVLDSLVETTISRDVLLMSRVDKPVLLRRLFELGCRYSGQELSYTKMQGQLQDAGNTTTLAHYLDLLESAGMLRGLPKYSGHLVRQRASSPKLQVMNTALMSATLGLTLEEATADARLWGRLAESAVGAHLANAEFEGICKVSYWRERDQEVDFVVSAGKHLVGIEVKTGRTEGHSGLAAFVRAHPSARPLALGSDGLPLEVFLSQPVSAWLGGA